MVIHFFTHSSEDKKLLGYEYSTVSDKMKIAHVIEFEPTGNSVTNAVRTDLYRILIL